VAFGNNPVCFRDLFGLAPGDNFGSTQGAAHDFGSTYNDDSIAAGQEYGTAIYPTDGGYTYSEPDIGDADSVDISYPPNGADIAAIAHCHGEYLLPSDNNFSQYDKNAAASLGVKFYVATPDGSFKVYDPATGKTTALSKDMPRDPKAPCPE